jgi:phosphoglycerate dehydrogenase-like enzyme
MTQDPVVLIPNERMLAPCLDPAAARLSELGFAVLRPGADAPRDWADELALADVVVLTPRNRFGHADILAAPRLKGVVFPTIGVEALDLDAAGEFGLAVGFGATPEVIAGMAEANVLMIAAVLLDLPRKQRALVRSGWRDGGVRAHLVEGKTIGFVGFGRIARATLRRLAGWGITPLYYDPHVGAADAEGVARAADLASLLRASDVVAIMVDQRPETVGMIGEAELEMMKRDACLVNAARGAVVDEGALARALADGVIAGAALDAFATEPLSLDSPLRALDNVLLTPHNLGHTVEHLASFATALVDNVAAIARGEPPPFFKNPQVLSAWRARLARLAEGTRRTTEP